MKIPPFISMGKNYQLISLETSNVLQTLLTITQLTQMKMFAIKPLSGGAAVVWREGSSKWSK